MTIGVDPPDAREQAPIAVVHAFDILGTPPDGTFDRTAAIAARTFDVPIGMAVRKQLGEVRLRVAKTPAS
jgi:sigma-B regulation protein RsbU (phosphoserine phosphatase)